MTTELELKVARAPQEDAERGIIRIDSVLMHEIAVSRGDVVELKSKKQTIAIVESAYPSDTGRDIVKMGGIIRRNAGVSVGEIVKIKKADVKMAKKVILKSRDDFGLIAENLEMFETKLVGRVAVEGDIIVPVPRINSDLGLQVASVFEGAGLKLEVISTEPKGNIIFTDITKIVILAEDGKNIEWAHDVNRVMN